MILIIDDDREVLDIFQDKIARTEGDTLTIACETIEQALKVIQSPPEDISRIYLDIYLPGVDGADSVALISSAIKDMNPKPLINSMSGDTSVRIKQAAIANGARKFFNKSDLLKSEETFLESMYFEERRRPRDDMKDWKRGFEKRIEGIEETVKQVQSLIIFSPDSIATQVARLQGEQFTDGVRIDEVKKGLKELSDELKELLEVKLKGLLDLLDLAKKAPYGTPGAVIIFLVLLFAVGTLGDNVLRAAGVNEGVSNFIQKLLPEKKSDR